MSHCGQTIPALLANPDFYGTLAATRSLGTQGIPVYIAGDRKLAVSRWSRHVTKTMNCPPLRDSNQFLDWLCELGQREPGVMLYPTSDDTAYLYASRRDELQRRFRMYQPDLDVMVNVLDKKLLYALARGVGMQVPQTWFPETDADVARIAREARMPVLVKPRTQVLTETPTKGIVVKDPSELVVRYREVVQSTRYGQALLNRIPDAANAMIQEYLTAAADQIYVLAAFVDREEKLFAARAGMKIFQRPRRLGIGLCFEDAPLEPAVCEQARALARTAGYYGLFQLEFVKDGDRFLLIDFNPRFYNQLAFDIARGLPLPAMVHAAARGGVEEVTRLVASAAHPSAASPLVYCNDFGLQVMLFTQRLTGRISASDAARWRRWRKDHDGAVVDPAVNEDDTCPGVVDALSQIYGYARHPRAFLWQIVLDRTPTRAPYKTGSSGGRALEQRVR